MAVGGGLVVAGALALTGITAFACSTDATLSVTLDPAGTVIAGQPITGTGSVYDTAPGSNPFATVTLHAAGGAVLASETVAVSPAGTIQFSFSSAADAPGYYYLAAVQTGSGGQVVTPNRPHAAVTIVAAPAPEGLRVQAPAQPPLPDPGSMHQPVAASELGSRPASNPDAAPKALTTGVSPAHAPAPAIARAPRATAGDAPSSWHATAILVMALVMGVVVLAAGVAAACFSTGRAEQAAEARQRR